MVSGPFELFEMNKLSIAKLKLSQTEKALIFTSEPIAPVALLARARKAGKVSFSL